MHFDRPTLQNLCIAANQKRRNLTMKKKLSMLLALVLALALCLTACGGNSGGSIADTPAEEPAETEAPAEDAAEAPAAEEPAAEEPAAETPSADLTFATGSSTGTYYGFGGVIAQDVSANTNVNVTAISSDGSKANILMLESGDAQLGFSQSDVMAYAYNGTSTFAEEGAVEGFSTVAALYMEAVQIVTCNPDIKTVADLAGKKVSIGAAGSGVYFNAMDVLAAAGLTENDINAQYQSFADSTDALKDGKIDAAFIVAGAPTAAITELCTTNSAYLVPIDGDIAAKLMADCDFYTSYTIPAGTYAGQDEDVTTVTVKATLIVAASASEDDVYNLTKAIFDNVDAIAAENGKGKELSIENATSGMAAPFHAGAAKYFAEKGVTVPTE